MSKNYREGEKISSIEAGDFDASPNLTSLYLGCNEISSIETGVFSGLSNLEELLLNENPNLTELNLAEADFSSLGIFWLQGRVPITSVSLNGAVLNQTSFEALMLGGGIIEADRQYATITEMDLSGVDFANITDLTLSELGCPVWDYMPDLTNLWLVGTQNLDHFALDEWLDNLPAIEGTDVEGVLYMTRADCDAFNTAGGGLLAIWNDEPGHHVQFVPEPSSLVLLLAGVMCLALGRSRA